MKIAIATDNKYVSEHFGRCPSYTIVMMENGEAKDTELINNPGHQPGFIPKFLDEMGIKTIICGGIGARAIGFFDELDIKVISGVSGLVSDVIISYSEGSLKDNFSPCKPGAGKGYGVDKTECDHED